MAWVTIFDPRTPAIARVYDYLLGGKDNFAADRAVAEQLLAVYPPISQTVPESRRFVERAVSWVAGQGITRDAVLGAASLRAVIDLSKPVCVLMGTYNASGFATMYNHTSADFATFFDGLEIMPPGLGDTRRIRPGWSELIPAPKRPDRIVAGIARVP